MTLSKSVCLFAVTSMMVLGGLWACGSSGSTISDAAALTRADIPHYQQWTRINPTPVLFAAPISNSCAQPGPVLPAVPNAHQDKYITVYVNSVGTAAMTTQLRPSFPVGSVIVKEKRSAANAPNVELMTVMVKREKGYNPQSGDWEYAVVDGTGAQVQASGKLSNCQACHVQMQNTDYVFRTPYVPASITNQWK